MSLHIQARRERHRSGDRTESLTPGGCYEQPGHVWNRSQCEGIGVRLRRQEDLEPLRNFTNTPEGHLIILRYLRRRAAWYAFAWSRRVSTVWTWRWR